MGIIINEKNLFEILNEFHSLTGLKVSFIVDYESPVMGVPNDICDICAFKQKENRSFYYKCKECDKSAMQACQKSDDFYLYECHYHLYEGIQPVSMQGKHVGYFVLGQMLLDKDRFIALSKPTAHELELISKLHAPPTNLLYSSAKILSWLAKYAFLNKDIDYINKESFSIIDSYIRQNLKEELTIDSLCQKFFYARSTLFGIFKQEYNCGVMEYIQNLRLETSKDLLKHYKVIEVAAKVGIPDSNYFSRLFKKKYNISPSQLQKTLSNH